MTDLLLLILAVLVGLAFAHLVLWQAIAPTWTFREFARVFWARRIDYLVRLWRFWGPRATDKNALGILFANIAMLNLVDPATLDAWQMAIWVGSNVLFTPWEHLPTEKLAPARGPGAEAGA